MKNEDANMELETALKNGKQVAEQVARHLHMMGAGHCSIPVDIDGTKYVVEVSTEHTHDFAQGLLAEKRMLEGKRKRLSNYMTTKEYFVKSDQSKLIISAIWNHMEHWIDSLTSLLEIEAPGDVREETPEL